MATTDYEQLTNLRAIGLRIKSACIGCEAEIFYIIDFDGAEPGEVLGSPEPEPEESGCFQHGHGHLCPPCSSVVADLLRRRREDRAKNHAAVVRGHR